MKTNKIKLADYKVGIIASLVGFIMLVAFFAVYSNIATVIAEKQIFSYNKTEGSQGSSFEGLSIEFERDNVNCSGLFVFSCDIKEPKVRIPSLNEELLTMDSIRINGLTKDGFQNGRNTNIDLEINQIKISKKLSLMDRELAFSDDVEKLMTPFSLRFRIDSERGSLIGNSKSHVVFDYVSNFADLTLDGNIRTEVRNNTVLIDENMSVTRNNREAVAEKGIRNTLVTILEDFKLTITDKESISKLGYTLYKYYFSAYTTEKEKEYFNISMIGYNSSKMVSFETFKQELSDRLNALIPNYPETSVKDQLIALDGFVTENVKRFELRGLNRANYTISEINTASEFGTLGKDQEKFFDLTVTTGGI